MMQDQNHIDNVASVFNSAVIDIRATKYVCESTLGVPWFFCDLVISCLWLFYSVALVVDNKYSNRSSAFLKGQNPQHFSNTVKLAVWPVVVCSMFFRKWHIDSLRINLFRYMRNSNTDVRHWFGYHQFHLVIQSGTFVKHTYEV